MLRFQTHSNSSTKTLLTNEYGHYWELKDPQNRTMLSCNDPTAPTILLMGSSILYGSKLADENTITTHLKAEFVSRGVDNICIRNHAKPGSNFNSQYAEAMALPPSLTPLITIWEIWYNSPSQYVKIGSSLYNFGRDDSELPDHFNLGWLNYLLFSKSQLYRYFFSTRLIPKPNSSLIWERFADSTVPKMKRWAQKHKTKIMAFGFPKANKPYAEQSEVETNSYDIIGEKLREEGIPFHKLSQELPEKQRGMHFLDQCCHFSNDGAKTLANILTNHAIPYLQQNTMTPENL